MLLAGAVPTFYVRKLYHFPLYLGLRPLLTPDVGFGVVSRFLNDATFETRGLAEAT
jgi:hypothetical protein